MAYCFPGWTARPKAAPAAAPTPSRLIVNMVRDMFGSAMGPAYQNRHAWTIAPGRDILDAVSVLAESGGMWLFRAGQILLPAGGEYPRDAVRVLAQGSRRCGAAALPVMPLGGREIVCLESADIARLRMRKVDSPVRGRSGNDGLAEARTSLAAGEIVANALLTLEEAMEDEDVAAAIGSRGIASAELAQEAGFDVRVRVQLWDNGEVDTGWKVDVPEGLEGNLEALVWDYPDNKMAYTLTRSTRHSGWQLTSWLADGAPWGHVEIEGDLEDAFDVDPCASGQSLSGLVQVILRDGRVLMREGERPIAFNPSRVEQAILKRSLL